MRLLLLAIIALTVTVLAVTVALWQTNHRLEVCRTEGEKVVDTSSTANMQMAFERDVCLLNLQLLRQACPPPTPPQ